MIAPPWKDNNTINLRLYKKIADTLLFCSNGRITFYRSATRRTIHTLDVAGYERGGTGTSLGAVECLPGPRGTAAGGATATGEQPGAKRGKWAGKVIITVCVGKLARACNFSTQLWRQNSLTVAYPP